MKNYLSLSALFLILLSGSISATDTMTKEEAQHKTYKILVEKLESKQVGIDKLESQQVATENSISGLNNYESSPYVEVRLNMDTEEINYNILSQKYGFDIGENLAKHEPEVYDTVFMHMMNVIRGMPAGSYHDMRTKDGWQFTLKVTSEEGLRYLSTIDDIVFGPYLLEKL